MLKCSIRAILEDQALVGEHFTELKLARLHNGIAGLCSAVWCDVVCDLVIKMYGRILQVFLRRIFKSPAATASAYTKCKEQT
jgi:hypothetical protein